MNVNRFFKRSKIDFENFSQKYYCWKIVREENCLHVWNTEREIFHGRSKMRLKVFDSKILFDSKKYYFESVDMMIKYKFDSLNKIKTYRLNDFPEIINHRLENLIQPLCVRLLRWFVRLILDLH